MTYEFTTVFKTQEGIVEIGKFLPRLSSHILLLPWIRIGIKFGKGKTAHQSHPTTIFDYLLRQQWKI